MIYYLTCSLAYIFCKLFFRLEARGQENVPRRGGFILASNHTSYLDPVVLTVSCPRRLSFMARHDLFTIPVFGAYLLRLGAFPVKREFADVSSIKESLRRLRRTGGLLIFPEGGRSFSELVRSPEPGIAFIAFRSKVPVVPAFVKGAIKALNRDARFIRAVKVKVNFGKPIYPIQEELITKDYEGFANRIMEEINQLSQA